MDLLAIASGSGGNCYIVNGEIMIECGLPLARIRKGGGYKLSEIKACLISHEH